MRDIKFRQLLKHGFEYFGFIELIRHEVWVSPPNVNRCAFPVQQYTGLKNKNGIEIYEGDIYLVDGYGLAKVIIDPYHGVSFEGVENEWSGVITLSHVIQLDLDYDRKGNIHQNPELLEK